MNNYVSHRVVYYDSYEMSGKLGHILLAATEHEADFCKLGELLAVLRDLPQYNRCYDTTAVAIGLL